MSKLTILLLLLALVAVTLVAGQSHDQVEAGVQHARKTLKDLDTVNGGRKETASARKIRKLNAPKVEYYHQIQKTNDREVDLTARAIIETPERIALRQRKIDDKIFTKRVSEASTLLNAHNSMKKVKAPPKLSLY